MFDSTEIDEILTLRVLTLTDEEKAQARATDPRAAAIIDRCEQLSPEELQRLHGILRDPHAGEQALTGDDWWAAEAAAPVSPETDAVVVAGTPVRARQPRPAAARPARRRPGHVPRRPGGRVSAVHVDLDGETHVAVTLRRRPGRRAARLVRPLPLLRPRRARAARRGADDPTQREETST